MISHTNSASSRETAMIAIAPIRLVMIVRIKRLFIGLLIWVKVNWCINELWISWMYAHYDRVWQQSFVYQLGYPSEPMIFIFPLCHGLILFNELWVKLPPMPTAISGNPLQTNAHCVGNKANARFALYSHVVFYFSLCHSNSCLNWF